MKRLFIFCVITQLFMPFMSEPIMPFASAQQAREFFIKTTFKKNNPITMPPYDYDPEPIVPQRERPWRYNNTQTERLKTVTQWTLEKSEKKAPIIDREQEQEITDLINQGADPNIWPNPFCSLLDVALRRRNLPFARACIEHGAKMEPCNLTAPIKETHPRPMPCCVYAAEMHSLLMSCCVDAHDEHGGNILHYYYNLTPKQGYLYCRQGADATKKSWREKRTPLHDLMMEIYRREDYDLNDHTHFFAIAKVVLEKMAALHWKGASLYSKDNEGRTVLRTFANKGLIPMIKAITLATRQEKANYITEQTTTPTLLQKHLNAPMVPMVMDYLQPTWLHEIWPAIQKKAALDEHANINYEPAPSFHQVFTYNKLQEFEKLRQNMKSL